MRVENLDELKCRLRQLLDDSELAFSDFRQHQTMCSVVGKTARIQAHLAVRLPYVRWQGEAGRQFFRDDAQNLLIYLAPARGATLVTATVLSLHEGYLAGVAKE